MYIELLHIVIWVVSRMLVALKQLSILTHPLIKFIRELERVFIDIKSSQMLFSWRKKRIWELWGVDQMLLGVEIRVLDFLKVSISVLVTDCYDMCRFQRYKPTVDPSPSSFLQELKFSSAGWWAHSTMASSCSALKRSQIPNNLVQMPRDGSTPSFYNTIEKPK